jgi:hypothetical protein
MKVKDLVKEFRDQCQSRITSKNFSPADFENSMTKKLSEHESIISTIYNF